jgi:hypothetical protein
MIRFRKGLDHGWEPVLSHRASPAQAAAPSPQGPASAVLTGASLGAAASAGALGMEQSCTVKVVGNENQGGLGRRQMLGNGLGPWRSRLICHLNMQLSFKNHISVSACNSKINGRLLLK